MLSQNKLVGGGSCVECSCQPEKQDTSKANFQGQCKLAAKSQNLSIAPQDGKRPGPCGEPFSTDLSHRAITRDLQHVSCKAHRVRGACNYSHEEGICPRAWTPQAQRKACRKFSYAALHSHPAPVCLLGHLKAEDDREQPLIPSTLPNISGSYQTQHF